MYISSPDAETIFSTIPIVLYSLLYSAKTKQISTNSKMFWLFFPCKLLSPAHCTQQTAVGGSNPFKGSATALQNDYVKSFVFPLKSQLPFLNCNSQQMMQQPSIRRDHKFQKENPFLSKTQAHKPLTPTPCPTCCPDLASPVTTDEVLPFPPAHLQPETLNK